jgi:peptidoglycan/LPS O-acetylase OafA/YrhL
MFPFIVRSMTLHSKCHLLLFMLTWWLLALAAPAAYFLLAESTGLERIPAFDGSIDWARVINYNPLLRLPEFAMGIVLGHLFMQLRAEQASWGPIRQRMVSLLSVLAALPPLACLQQATESIPSLWQMG